LLFYGTDSYVGSHDTYAASSDDEPDPDVLTFKMKQLAAMSATGFEQACTDLLARDGFLGPRRVGGAGDLGVDVTARDHEGRLLILQCKPSSASSSTCPLPNSVLTRSSESGAG
jgi:restriction system protein